MKGVRRVVIGIVTGIICGEILHLLEAMLNGEGIGLVAQMPFSGEIRRVAVLLEKLGNGRRFFPQPVSIPRWNFRLRSISFSLLSPTRIQPKVERFRQRQNIAKVVL